MRTLSRIGPVLLLVGLGLAGCAPSGTTPRVPWGKGNDPSQAPPEASSTTLMAGTPAPETEGQDGDGKTFQLSDYRGQVVLLDFWAGW